MLLDRLLRPVAGLLLVALAPLALDGCVSVGLTRSAAGDEETGEVAVSVYRKTAERNAGVPVAFPVLSELQKVEAGARTTVARSMASSWSVPAVPPGRYALRVARKIDEHGDVVPLKKPYSREFDVAAGQRVEATVVLEKVPVGWIILAAVTVVSTSRSPSPGARPRARAPSSRGWPTSFPRRARSSPRAGSRSAS